MDSHWRHGRAEGSPLLGEERAGNGASDETTPSRSNQRSRGRTAVFTLVVLAMMVFSAAYMFGTSNEEEGALSRLATDTVEVKADVVRYSDMSKEEVDAAFQAFVELYDKVYEDETERTMRIEIFKSNLARIDKMNSRTDSSVVYKITQFADLTREEFQSQLTNGMVSESAKAYAKEFTKTLSDMDKDFCQSCTRFPELEMYTGDSMPMEFDWRDYGAVTLVKNQAYCGSCWSFSATGALEGAWYVAGNDLVSLSEQQLVTCNTEYNQGCWGGWPALAMIYISENGGLVPESIYPYRKLYMGGPTSHPPVCKSVVKAGNYIATMTDGLDMSSDVIDEDLMALWLIKYGPLSVALDATGMDSYSSGIDMGDNCDPTDLNHAVLLVGFGEENGVKYWIIKNSWAIWWGEQGYYRLLRGINACGIASEPSVQNPQR